MSEVSVKIDGIMRLEDARHAVTAGADYIGAILSEGFGRSISPEIAREFTPPDGPPFVAVFVDEPTEALVAKARRVNASVLQLHGDETPATLDELRREGSWALWKAVRPRTRDELLRAVEHYVEHANGLLVDGWHRDVPGGSGVRVPAEVVERICADVPESLTLIFAGGLTPETVADAVARVAPDVVDVSSGVESERGKKDHAKVEAFIRAARSVTPATRGAS